MSSSVTPPTDAQDLATQPLVKNRGLEPGQLLAGRFRILAPLGAGAQGRVYSAHDKVLNTDIAIKLVASDQGLSNDSVQQLRDEVLLARELHHPHIVRVHEFYQEQDWVFYTMNQVTGHPLHELMHQGLSRDQVDKWLAQLLSAIEACHQAGISHADIKPDNILINDQQDLVLVDFGIGCRFSTPMVTAGHPDFAAPEAMQLGQLTPYSDNYSVGVLLQQLLAAVSIRRWHPADIGWMRRRRNLAEGLSRELSQQRISLEQAQRNLRPISWGLPVATVSLALLTLSILFLWHGQGPTPIEEGEVTRIAIVYSDKDPILDPLAGIIELPLAANPALDVIEPARVRSLIRNLHIEPSLNRKDRARLADLLNADSLLILRSQGMPDNHHLVQAWLVDLPENQEYGEVQVTAASHNLPSAMTQIYEELMDNLGRSRLIEDPTDALLLLQPVYAALKRGEHERAQDLILRLQQQKPNYPGGWLEGAKLAYEQGDDELAKSQLTQLFSLSQSDSYWTLKGRVLEAYLSDDAATAIGALNQLLSHYPQRADLLAQRAFWLTRADRSAEAMTDYQAALALDPGQANWWYELAVLRVYSEGEQAAIDNEFTQALIKYRQNGDVKGEGKALNAIGVAFQRMGEYAKALRYFEDAVEIRTATQDPEGRVTSLINMVAIEAIRKDYDRIDTLFQEAESINENLDNPLLVADVERAKGFGLEEKGRYVESLKHYKMALDIRIQHDTSLKQAQTINDVAFIHFLMGDFSLADIYWKQAENLFARVKDEALLTRTRQSLAQLALARGNITKATQILTQTLEQEANGNQEEAMMTQYLLSKRNFDLGLVQAALENIEKAKQSAKSQRDINAINELVLWHAEVCMRLAMWQCAKQQLNQVGGHLQTMKREQATLFEWLRLAVGHHRGIGQTDLSPLWEKLRGGDLPILVELKLLLDSIERFGLGPDSWQWRRVQNRMSPNYYKEHLQWLYLQALRGRELNSLKQGLADHPQHWRNHLYYTVFEDMEARGRQFEAQQRFFEQLNEQQINQYRASYMP